MPQEDHTHAPARPAPATGWFPSNTERKLDWITLALAIILKGQRLMAIDLSDIKASLDELEATAVANKAELDDIAAKLDAALAAGGNTVDPAEIAALAARVRAVSASIQAADAADARP